jgi:hypothetical protein
LPTEEKKTGDCPGLSLSLSLQSGLSDVYTNNIVEREREREREISRDE